MDDNEIEQPGPGRLAPQINPATGQPDYSAQWAEYYRSLGMNKDADMCEVGLGGPAGPQQQDPDYSAQWCEYYRSIGKHKEADAIEAQMRAKLKFEHLRLLIRNLTLEMEREYCHRLLGIKTMSEPAKKTSLKRKMLNKIHDRHENFEFRKLREVIKRWKKFLANKRIFLQKDMEDLEEANLLNGYCETSEEFEILHNSIQKELEALFLEEMEIVDLERKWYALIPTFYEHKVMVFHFQKSLLVALAKAKKFIDYEETIMAANYEEKMMAANETSLETDSASENKRRFEKCCWFCSSEEEGSLLKCSGCKKAYYCNEKCIEQDWPVHGNWCIRRRKKREERKLP